MRQPYFLCLILTLLLIFSITTIKNLREENYDLTRQNSSLIKEKEEYRVWGQSNLKAAIEWETVSKKLTCPKVCEPGML